MTIRESAHPHGCTSMQYATCARYAQLHTCSQLLSQYGMRRQQMEMKLSFVTTSSPGHCKDDRLSGTDSCLCLTGHRSFVPGSSPSKQKSTTSFWMPSAADRMKFHSVCRGINNTFGTNTPFGRVQRQHLRIAHLQAMVRMSIGSTCTACISPHTYDCMTHPPLTRNLRYPSHVHLKSQVQKRTSEQK
jgi:hypothetical protein